MPLFSDEKEVLQLWSVCDAMYTYRLLKVRIILCLMLGLVCVESMWSQCFQVHLSQPCYIVGDELAFTIYPVQQIWSDSMLIYVELYSPAGKMEMQQIHQLYGQSIHGSSTLPITLQENVYELICYAVWDHNTLDTTTIRSHQIFFPIYNDLQGPPILSEANLDFILPTSPPRSSEDSVKDRTKVQLTLGIADQPDLKHARNYSATILPEWMDRLTPTLNFVIESDPGDIAQFSMYSIRKQLVLEGKVKHPINKLPSKDKYLSLYIPTIGHFKRLSTNNGHIKTILPNLQGLHRLQILSMNPNTRYPMEVEVKQSHAKKDRLRNTTVNAIRSSDIMTWMIQHSKKRMVDDLFGETPSNSRRHQDSIVSFRPDRKFIMTDFQELKTLEEFIKEVLLDARVTRVIDNKKSLRLRSKDKNQLYQWPAWYLLDGIFQSDEDAMLNYDIGKIKSIELYQRNTSIESQFDPLMKYNGIFSINTYLHDEPQRFLYPVSGLHKNPEVLSNRSEVAPMHVPDLRTILLWQTDQSTDQNGQIKMQYNSSDIRGHYVLSLMGVGTAGEFIQYKRYINVD